MTTDELKPCPFCGSEARLLRGGTEVVCSSDGETGCNAVYFAVSDWNRRPVEDALRDRAEAAEAAEQRAEVALAQARADRALLTGLWLATVPPDVVPTLLPADPGNLDRLAAALEAVDLQSGTESHTAAVRAIIARIVAETAGGAR